MLAADWSMESIKMKGECGSLCLRRAVQGSRQASRECEAMEERNREEVKAQRKRWRERGKKEKVKERKKRWKERKNKEKDLAMYTFVTYFNLFSICISSFTVVVLLCNIMYV